MADVIILEDDPTLGPLLKQSLEDAGHVVRLFLNATDTLAAFDDRLADVFVADIIVKQNGVPVPDGGIIALSRVKTLVRARGAKVCMIAISGSYVNPGMENILTTASTVGADLVLQKPFPPEELIALIDRALKGDEAGSPSVVGSG